MNRAVNSTAPEKRSVRGVHNRIDLDFGDIAEQDADVIVARFQGPRRSIDQEPFVCDT